MGSDWEVSTHSRLKAAGFIYARVTIVPPCFNTQPPEGGWLLPKAAWLGADVSTHSRLKAAGRGANGRFMSDSQFQHTAA